MNVENMRAIIASCYKTDSWQNKVKNMSDAQVIAVYNRLRSSGKIK